MEVLKQQEIIIKHDGTLNIAIGKSRTETHWKNSEILWSAFVKKVSTTTRTAETYNDYMKSPKSRQDEIKDVGGFVGGYVSNGRRKNGNIANRQFVTLDVDFGNMSIWEDLTMLYGCAAVVYSTHKHSPTNPRLRIVIALDRPVFTDEYEAIARKIAGDLGINAFDDTTFEPARLMYWPSTPKDGVYVFKYFDGPWIKADEILATYHDWKDSSAWPVSDRTADTVKREMKKQGDPLEKPGLIGTFCRTFTIQEAIDTYLSDVYERCAVEGRYTYKQGSTAAGLVIYEDKFAYSHHGTDPISGKLCNAFDIVRIHNFGLKDEDAKEGTPNNKLPSYTAMTDFASKIPEVRQQLAIDKKHSSAAEDFDDEIDTSWYALLDVDSKGNYYSTIDNVKIILENDYKLKGKFAVDEFAKAEVIRDDLPWRRYAVETERINDNDIAGLRHYLETEYDLTKTTKMEDAFSLVVNNNSFHPVKDYLNRLKWDGVKRIEQLFIDFLGAEDNEYTRAATRKLLAGAVARIFKPGCKFDYILVLVGPQGIGKSSIIRVLGKRWFSDTLVDIKGKEAYQQLLGVWLMEMGELSSLNKAELEVVKHFMTKQWDDFRPPYGKYIVRQLRQCVFFGTTNNSDFLRDPTGGRRFWPIDCMVQEPIKRWQDLKDAEIDQIWAEAKHYYEKGEKLYFEDKRIEEMAIAQQKSHSEEDERTGIIREYLDQKLPENWSKMDALERRRWLEEDEEVRAEGVKVRDRVCVSEIWCEALKGNPKDLKDFEAKKLHNLMRNMDGWMKAKGKLKFGKYGAQRGYFRVAGTP